MCVYVGKVGTVWVVQEAKGRYVAGEGMCEEGQSGRHGLQVCVAGRRVVVAGVVTGQCRAEPVWQCGQGRRRKEGVWCVCRAKGKNPGGIGN